MYPLRIFAGLALACITSLVSLGQTIVPICSSPATTTITSPNNGATQYWVVDQGSGTFTKIGATDNYIVTNIALGTNIYHWSNATGSPFTINNYAAYAGADACVTPGSLTLNGTNPAPIAGASGIWTCTSANSSDITFSNASSYNTTALGLKGGQTYRFRWTLTFPTATCSGSSTFDEVTYSVTPSTFNVTGGGSFCTGSPGATIGLSGSETGVTYQLKMGAGNVGGPINGTNAALSWTNNTTNGTYTVVATNTLCATNVNMNGSVTVTQRPRPTITLTGSNTICAGSSTPLTFTPTAGSAPWTITYTANGVAASPISTNATTNVNVSPTSTTTYSITTLKDLYCTAIPSDITGSATVTVNPKPTASISGSPTICAGASTSVQINLTGTAPWNVVYNNGAGNVTINGITSSPYTLNVNPTSSTTYTLVSVTDNNNCIGTVSGSASVTVNSLPVVNAGADVTICNGQTATLTASGANTYTWSNGANGASISVTPTTTTSYTVTGTNGYGCTNTDIATVFVNAVPTANAGGDKVICKGESITLNATGGGTYNWNTTPVLTTQSITVSPITTTNYIVTVTNAAGCKSTATAKVTVNSNPTVSAGVDQYMCHGTSVNITANAAGGTPGYTYLWSNGKLSPTISENPTNTTTVPIISYYSVIAEDVNRCKGYDTMRLTVYPLPTVGINNLDNSYCRDNGAFNITGVPTAPAPLNGSFTISAGTLVDNGNSTATFNPSAQSPGSYYDIKYTYKDGNNCTASIIRTVYIRNEISPTVSIGAISPLFCDDDDDTYTVTGSPLPGPNRTGHFTGISDNNNGTGSFIPKNLGLGNYTATYTVTDSYTIPVVGQCQSSASANFTVGVPVTINTQPDYCVSTGPFTLTVNKPAGTAVGNFVISKGGIDLYSGAEGVATFDPSTIGTGTYVIKYTTSSTSIVCSATAYDTVTVHNLPIPSFTVNGTFNTDPNIDVCYNGGNAILAGNPNPGGVFSGTGVSGNIFNPVTAGIGINKIITYTFTDQFGCVNSNTANVEVLSVPPASITLSDSIFCHSDIPVTLIGNPKDDGNGNVGKWILPTNWTSSILKDNGDGTATFYPTNTPLGINNYTIGYQVKQPTGCISSAKKQIVVNFLPTVDFAGLPTSICINDLPVTLTGNPLPSAPTTTGTFSGNGITNLGGGKATFNPAGLAIISHTITYTFLNNTTGCQDSKIHNVLIKQKPTQFTVTGGGTYCANNNTNRIGLNGSETNTTYTLLLNGVAIGTPMTGTGSALDFGNQTIAGTYTITAKNSPNGCTETMLGSAVLTVTPLPLGPTSITGSTSVCPGTSYTYSVPVLTNATSYVWTLPAGATITAGSGTRTITVLFNSTITPGNATIKVKGNNACGDGPEISTTITIRPLPSLPGTITGDVSICQGKTNESYSIAPVTNATSYVWTLPFGISAVSGSTTNNIVVNYAANALSGTIIVAGRNACGTGPSNSLNITVTPTPNVAIDPPSGPVNCTGNQITLNATTTTLGTSSYSWAASLGGNIVSGGPTKNPKVDKAGTYTVTLTEPVNSCTVKASVSVVSDYVAPTNVSVTTNITSKILTCTNPQATLTATATCASPVTYTWVATLGGNIVSGGTTATPVINKAGTYTVTVTNTANGCTATGSIVFTENLTPPVITINKNPAQLNCVNTKVQLSASSPNTTYLWTGPAGATFTGGNTITNPQVDKAGVYTFTATSTINGCSAQDQLTVVENIALPASVSINPPAKITCTAQSINLTAQSNTASVTYLWQPSNGGTISSGSTNPVVTVTSDGDYTVTVTHPTSLCSVSVSAHVDKDITAPTISFPTTPAPITCKPPITSTINSNINPTTYTVLWTGPSITSSASIKDITVNAPGTYSITAINTATGCSTIRTIDVPDGRIKPTVKIADPITLTCLQPTVTLQGTTSIVDYTALWTTTDGAISGSTSNLNAIAAKPGTYKLTITDNINGCSDFYSALVKADTISPDIYANLSPANLTCTNTQVMLSGSSITVPTPSYKWTGPATAVITGDNTKTPMVNLPGIYTLTLTSTSNGCKSSKKVTVVENKIPPSQPNIKAPANLTCTKTTTDLEVSPALSNVDYQWSTTNGSIIINPNSSIATVSAIGTYKVVVTDRTNGCTNENTVVVSETKTPPTVSIAAGPRQINCTTKTLILDGSASIGINPTWNTTLGGHILSGGNSTQATIDAKGSYTLTMTNAATGCTATSAPVVISQDATLPDISIDSYPGNINCAQSTVTLSGSTTSTGTTTGWVAAPGHISGGTVDKPVVDKGGIYIYEVKFTATGCTSRASVEVKQDTVSPNITTQIPAKITCTTSQVQLSASSTNKVSYNWTTSGTGTLKAGTANTANPIALSKGIYTITIRDSANKCIATRNVEVFEDKTLPQVSVNKTPSELNCTVNEVVLSGSAIPNNSALLWTTTGSGNIINNTTQNPRVDAPGYYRLTVTHPVSGCTAKDSVYVNRNITPPDIWVDVNPLPLNAINITTQIKGNSTTPDVTYLWSGPGNISNNTLQEPYVDAAGTYTLTVTGKNNCKSEKPVVVTKNDAIPPAPVATGASVCYGSPAGTLTATGNNLKWYSDASLQTKVQDGTKYVPTLSTAVGTYLFFVTQTDPVSFREGPSTQVTYIVRGLPGAPSIVNNSVCQGSANTAIQALGTNIKWYDLPGGTMLYAGSSYTPSAAVSTPATYSYYATQTDTYGCQSSATEAKYTINPLINLSVIDPNPDKLTCSQTSVTLTGNADIANSTLSWTGPGIQSGANSINPVVNRPGVYTLTAINTLTGCKEVASKTVTVSQDITPPTVSFPIVPNIITCKNPTVNIQSNTSASIPQWQWSTVGGAGFVSTTQSSTVSVSSSGTYTLEVTDLKNGCVGNNSIVIQANVTKPLAIVGTIAPITCSQTSVTLPGSSPSTPISVLWTASNGGIVPAGSETSFTPTVSIDGVYTMTVTNTNNGCKDDTTVTVINNGNQVPVISINDTPEVLNCKNATVKLYGNATNATFLWTGPAGAVITDPTSSTPTVDQPGIYTIEATSLTGGCKATKTVEVKINKPTIAAPTIDAPQILSCTNKTIQLKGQSGISNPSYEWTATNGGHITSSYTVGTITVDKSGTYTLVVTDPISFCTNSASVNVISNTNAPVIQFPFVQSALSCKNTTAVITSTVTTTTSSTPTLQWTGPFGSSISDATILSPTVNTAGNYTLTATDIVTGCTASRTINVPLDTLKPSFFIATPNKISCKPTELTTQVIANTTVSNYTALWSTLDGSISGSNTSLAITASKKGTYTLTLTNNDNGCQASKSTLVEENVGKPSITVDPNPKPISCKNNPVELFGTAPNATLKWTGIGIVSGTTSSTPKVNSPGVFTLTATGDNGCTDFKTVTVTIDTVKPSAPVITFPDTIKCSKPIINISVSNPSGSLTYEWTTTGTNLITNANSPTAQVDEAGVYTVKATNIANGCSNSSSVTVAKNVALPDASITGTYQINCLSPTVTLTATSTVGINPEWSTNNGGHIKNGGNTFNPVVDADGNYFVTVTHPVSGCKANSNTITVSSDGTLPKINITPYADTLTCARPKVTISGSPVNPANPFVWTAETGRISDDITTTTPKVDLPGIYVITVTDPGTGCTSRASVTVTQNIAKPVVDIIKPDSITCIVHEIPLKTSVNITKAAYTWTANGTASIKTGYENSANSIALAAGIYDLSVKDLTNGCITTKSVQVYNNNADPTISVNKTPAKLTCDKTQVILSGSSTSDVSYMWTSKVGATITNANSKNPTVSNTGFYYLTVTDNHTGCTKVDSVEVKNDTIRPAIWVNALPDSLNCKHSIVTLNGSSTTPNTSFGWTGPNGFTSSTQQVDVTAKGLYTFTVTNPLNGCSNIKNVNVIEDKVKPAAPLVTTATNCIQSLISPLIATGSQIKWYSDATLSNSGLVGTGASFMPSVTTAGVHQFYVTQTNPLNGCESDASTADFNVKPRSAQPVVTPIEICEGVTVPALSAIGENIQWYSTPTSGLLGSGNTYSTGKTLPGTYIYYVSQTETTIGCESETTPIQLTIHEIPTAPVLDNPTHEVCFDLAIPTLSASGNSVNWYGDNTLAVSIHQGNSYTPDLTATGTYDYYATQTSIYGCESPSSHTNIVLKENPSQYIVSGGGSYCQGGAGMDVMLSNSENGVTYQLLRDGSFTTAISLVGTGAPLNFGKQTVSGVYSVLAQTPTNCSIKMNGEVAVIMNPLPGPGGGITGDTYACQNSTASYVADSIANAVTYEWDLPLGATILTGINSRTITVQFNSIAVSGTISVKGLNDCGYGISSLGKAVVVSPDPKATSEKIVGPTEICEGETAVVYQIKAIENATSYEWTIPVGAVIVDGDGTRQIVVDFSKCDVGGSFTVRGVNNCNKGPESDALFVSIKKEPYINAGTDASVCGSTSTLSASQSTGVWSVAYGPGIIQNTKIATTPVKNLMMGDNKFVWTINYYTKIDGTKCLVSDTVVVTNNKVTVDAGADQVLCSKDAQLKAITPLTGAQWSIVSGNALIDTPSSPTSTVSELAQDENKLSWYIYKGSCLSSDTVSIFNYRPLSPNAGSKQIVKNNFTQLTAKAPEDGTIGTWSVLSGSGQFADRNKPTSAITNLGPGINLLQWTVTRNSCNLTDTVSIIYETFEAADAGPDQTICTSFTTLRGNEPQLGTGQWSVISGSAIFENPKLYNTKVTGLSPDKNYLKWTLRRSGSASVSDTVVITNNSVTVSNAGRDQILCRDSATVSSNGALYGKGVWSVVSGSGIFKDTLNANTYITNLSPGNNILKWAISKASCYSESTVTITNNTPTTAYAGTDLTTCEDSVTLSPNNPTIGTGAWSVIKGSAVFNGNYATQLATNDNTFRWTITKGSCTSSDDVTITSHKASIANAGGNLSLCIDSVTLAGNRPIIGTGVWTIQNGSGIIADTTNYQSKVTKLGFGRNIFRWKITNLECSSYKDVEIYYGYIQANADIDQVLCDDKTSLKANSAWPGVGTWSIIGNSSAANIADVNSPNSQVTKIEKGTNTLRWTIVNRACVSFDEVKITNNLPSESYAGPDESVCGYSTTLDANPVIVGTGKWEILSGSGIIKNINAFNSPIDSLGLGNNILRWTTSNKGCYLTDEVKISNNGPIYVEAGKNQTLCDDSTSLYANRPSIGTGQWSVIQGSVSFTDNTKYNSSIYNLAQGVNILKWTVKSDVCKVSDTVYITNNLPDKSMAGPDKVFCQDSTTLAGNNPQIGTGEWWVINGSAKMTDKTKFNTHIDNLGFGENRLRWIITHADCQLYDDVILVNNLPSKPVVSDDHATCADSTVLFANTPDVGIGHWLLISGAGDIVTPESNQTQITNMGFGPNTFRWLITNKNCNLHSEVIVTNNQAEVNAGIDQIVFEPTSKLIGNNPIAGNGLWTLTAGAGSIAKPTDFTSDVSGLGFGKNTFTWSIDNNGCVASDMIDVTYYNMPIPDFSINTNNGCPPLTINFINKSIGGSPYKWDFGDGETSGEMNTSHIYTVTGVYKVRMTGTAPGGLTVFKDTVITVHNLPKASFNYSPTIVYIPGQQVTCVNTSTYADNFLWDFGDLTTSEERHPKHAYKDTGLYTIKLRAITSFGCTDSLIIEDAVLAKEAGDMKIPNAFSPNPNKSSGGKYGVEDVSNDVFYPIVVKGYIEDYNMKIYNRWGVKLFESSDLSIGWDGYYNGKLMEQDVYVYVITGKYNNGERFNKIGDILLVRKP